LTPWLPGVADYEKSPRVERLRAAMAALAQFHISVSNFPLTANLRFAAVPPAIAMRLARLRDLKSGGIEALARSINDSIWPTLAPLTRQFVAELPRAVPRAISQLAPLADAQLTRQPCIRDVWHDHVLFDGDRVTGLIDFGAVQIDTPATDIARLLGSLAADDPNGWRAGLAAYSAVRQLSELELQAIPALDAGSTILAGCNWIRWIYVDGRQFDNSHQITDRFARLLKRLHCISQR
jgi:homoserine kinase type II